MRRDDEKVVRKVIDHLGYVPDVGGAVLIGADERPPWSKQIDRRLNLRSRCRAGIDEHDHAGARFVRLFRCEAISSGCAE